MISYEQYEPEYIETNAEDDDRMLQIREAVKSLPLPERRIFLMYTEMGTYSAVAKSLHCSVPTVSKKISLIKSKLNSMLNDMS